MHGRHGIWYEKGLEYFSNTWTGSHSSPSGRMLHGTELIRCGRKCRRLLLQIMRRSVGQRADHSGVAEMIAFADNAEESSTAATANRRQS